jgi:hypothetical protein
MSTLTLFNRVVRICRHDDTRRRGGTATGLVAGVTSKALSYEEKNWTPANHRLRERSSSVDDAECGWSHRGYPAPVENQEQSDGFVALFALGKRCFTAASGETSNGGWEKDLVPEAGFNGGGIGDYRTLPQRTYFERFRTLQVSVLAGRFRSSR